MRSPARDARSHGWFAPPLSEFWEGVESDRQQFWLSERRVHPACQRLRHRGGSCQAEVKLLAVERSVSGRVIRHDAPVSGTTTRRPRQLPSAPPTKHAVRQGHSAVNCCRSRARPDVELSELLSSWPLPVPACWDLTVSVAMRDQQQRLGAAPGRRARRRTQGADSGGRRLP